MHFLGLASMPRRVPDYADTFYVLNTLSSYGSIVSMLSLLFFWISTGKFFVRFRI